MEEQSRERSKKFYASLDQASNELEQTIKASGTLKDIKNLPPTFYLIVEHLSILKDVVTSMRNRLRDGNVYQNSPGKSKAIYELSKKWRNQSKYLRDLIDAVTTTNTPTASDIESPAKLDAYDKVVEGSGGYKIDDVLKSLLQDTVAVTSATQLIDDNLRETLEKSLREIISLQGASSSEKPKAGVILSNYGSGSQYLHSGTGNQNRCDGGTQFTGNGTYNLGHSFKP
ncbi:hypothetical protein J3F84DRAFT_357046 [Trichoderma pleuroticola]